MPWVPSLGVASIVIYIYADGWDALMLGWDLDNTYLHSDDCDQRKPQPMNVNVLERWLGWWAGRGGGGWWLVVSNANAINHHGSNQRAPSCKLHPLAKLDNRSSHNLFGLGTSKFGSIPIDQIRVYYV
jgi:hypothetical protein